MDNKSSYSKEDKIKSTYFDEVKEWDVSINHNLNKSERRAWWVATGASLIAIVSVFAVVGLTPLKSIEPFIIRVDNSTGYVDVISTIAETDGTVKENAQELLDKYFLAKYIEHRESYHFNTRDLDRRITALLSSVDIQLEYADYTDPNKNANAPILIYDRTAEVEIGVPAISFINTETFKEEKRITALVRYTKQVKKQRELSPLTYWASTITFVYRSTPMAVEDRIVNPLGFQVISFRNDQEAPNG